MPDVQEVFRMATQKVLPDPGALERQNRNQRRRSTQRKAGAYALVAAFVVLGVIAAIAALRSNGTKKPASQPTAAPSIAVAGPRTQTPSVVRLDGTVQSEIPGLPQNAYGLGLSPDGTRIAFLMWTSQGSVGDRIGTMGIDGGGLRVIDPGVQVESDPNHGARVAWSPDGSRIAFVGITPAQEPNTDIYVMNADGSRVRRLTNDPHIDEWPAWSPDGSTIVYDVGGKTPPDGSGFSPTQEIYTIPASGGTATRLTRNQQPDAQPSFSPDGARIAYLHDGHIWVMNRDGSAAHEVVSIDASFSPSWSPDGSTIAFTTYDASWRPAASLGSLVGDWPALRVRVLDVKTGRVSAVGKTYMASDVNGPQWLPSGDALLLNLVQKP